MSISRKNSYTVEVFNKKLNEAKDFCTATNDKLEIIKKNRSKGLKLLQDVIAKLNVSYVGNKEAFTLVWCSLALIEFFHFYITPNECATKIPKKKKKLLDKSLDLLSAIVTKVGQHSKSVYVTILQFLTDASLWKTECLCAEVLKRLMVNPAKSMETIGCVFESLEKHPLESEHEGRVVIRVLRRVLDEYDYNQFDYGITERILSLYRQSVGDGSTGKYASLDRGLENCLKTIINRADNEHSLSIIEAVIDWTLEEGESVYEFGTILQYASMRHRVTEYGKSLNDRLFGRVTQLMQSGSSVACLLGHKLLQNLLDRHGNVGHFQQPRIYFAAMQYDLRLGAASVEDGRWMRRHRDALHEAVVSGVRQHGRQRGTVETVYTSLAVLVAEVRCGRAAATVTCVCMRVQQLALEEAMDPPASHRLHALVISLLSLVCWTFDASVFYEYVYEVMRSRAYAAPFLNPPLRYKYEYAEHNVLWNKRELFFEDWQVRYGIWNCFRPVSYSENALVKRRK